MKLEQLREQLRSFLDRPRYEHSLSVSYTAAFLASIYELDVEKAMIAGLLHDCAKCLPAKELFQLCKEHQIEMSQVEKSNPGLLHAKVGVFVAKLNFQIEDTEILDAIRYHTTGRPAMTPLEKIVFLADFIEPLRKKIPNLNNIRALAVRDIDRAVEESLISTLAHLEKKKLAIDESTELTLQYYISR